VIYLLTTLTNAKSLTSVILLVLETNVRDYHRRSILEKN